LGRVRERVALSLTAAFIAPGDPAALPPRAPAPAVLPAAASKLGLIAALGLGTLLGAVGHAWLRPPVERVVYRDRVVALPPLATAEGKTEPLLEVAATPDVAHDDAKRAPRAKSAPSLSPQPDLPSSHGDASLAQELRLLEQARQALEAGDPVRALRALESHAARYRAGILAQEREALRVKALVAGARFAEARATATAFAQAYPNSSLLTSVRAAVAAIP
jgi:hypothetical protein